jgi:deazaflavin-dependent oxidoreductase (nitroreductase family)
MLLELEPYLNLWIRLLMSINVLVYRLSRGRLSSRMAGNSILLLHTTGRKSGVAYTTPLTYFTDGENYLLVASNWGREHNPGWYYNLVHQPAATIQVKEQVIGVKAHPATGDEYSRLWKLVTGRNNFYVRYQKMTSRQIPIMLLTPDD